MRRHTDKSAGSWYGWKSAARERLPIAFAMKHFFHAAPITTPSDVIKHLGRGEKHWRKGYSAYELAHSWIESDGIPRPVIEVLSQAPELDDVELVEGLFEKETNLRSKGRSSQTDLLALVRSGQAYVVLGVEGKVEESFGPVVEKWRDGSPGKERRLAGLCETLEIDPARVDNLRYQLFHRTCAAIYEAQRYRVSTAVMLVHSFSAKASGITDYLAFTTALGVDDAGRGMLSSPTMREGIALRFAWVSDRPRID